jgi:signal transduction histidine kinase
VNTNKILEPVVPPVPGFNDHLLITYIADLELEVDRLRKQGQFLRQSVADGTRQIRDSLPQKSDIDGQSSRIDELLDELALVMRDLNEPPGYHPAHDQVTTIAIRPLIEQVFRWQQRILGATHAVLHLELSTETINWFPARCRHVIDNLISNALKYRDPEKGEARVTVALNTRADLIELRVTDNGLGMAWEKRTTALELMYRSAPIRNAGVGVGLAVVKLLIEQSGGSLTFESGEGQGSNFIVILPRYDVGDFLT